MNFQPFCICPENQGYSEKKVKAILAGILSVAPGPKIDEELVMTQLQRQYQGQSGKRQAHRLVKQGTKALRAENLAKIRIFRWSPKPKEPLKANRKEEVKENKEDQVGII